MIINIIAPTIICGLWQIGLFPPQLVLIYQQISLFFLTDYNYLLSTFFQMIG